MKLKKSKFLSKLITIREFQSEPKVMKDLHKIREEMSKVTKEEFHESLKMTSKDFKNLTK